MKTIGPFINVTRDKAKTYRNGRSLRLIQYGGYNAMGLIDLTMQYVTILDDDYRQVICDRIKTPFRNIDAMRFTQIKRFADGHSRSRMPLPEN